MKVKYLRMNKQDKKKAKNEFYQTETGKYVRKKLNVALGCSITLFIISIYLIIESFFFKTNVFDKIYAICILSFAIGLLITYRKIYVKKVNQYVTRNKK